MFAFSDTPAKPMFMNVMIDLGRQVNTKPTLYLLPCKQRGLNDITYVK